MKTLQGQIAAWEPVKNDKTIRKINIPQTLCATGLVIALGQGTADADLGAAARLGLHCLGKANTEMTGLGHYKHAGIF